MPVSSDSLVLADFTVVHPGERILDIGTGLGIVALALAAREAVDVVGIDNSFEALEKAGERLERDKETLCGTCRFEPGDLRNETFMRELGAFDQVVCNPPYYKVGEGRLPPSPHRAAARHETTCNLADVVQAADWALNGSGTFTCIQIPRRLPEILDLLTQHGFAPQAVQPVYTARKRDAELVLTRATKETGGTLRLLPPRCLRALTGV
jgi:tRNA1Val (adenine37-N6)-methyltransferase